MTAAEAIANLARVQEPAERFLYLAAHAHEFRLATGQRLLDGTDFKAFLVELAEASQPGGLAAIPPQKRWPRSVDLTCPRCGHVHESEGECGVAIGGGRYCHCELEVPA